MAALNRTVGFSASGPEFGGDVVRAAMVAVNRMHYLGYPLRQGQWIMPASIISVNLPYLARRYKATFRLEDMPLDEVVVQVVNPSSVSPGYAIIAPTFDDVHQHNHVKFDFHDQLTTIPGSSIKIYVTG